MCVVAPYGPDELYEFACYMRDGDVVVFTFLVSVFFIDFLELWTMESAQAGGFVECGAQGVAAAFAHSDGALPLSTFAYAGIESRVGLECFVSPVEALEVSVLCDDGGGGDFADSREFLQGVFLGELRVCARYGCIECLGLFLEKLYLV